MKVEVHIRNGRTVFRFAKRSHFTRVLQNAPDHQGGRVIAEVKLNVNDEFRVASVRSISPGSISHVLEVPQSEEVIGDAEEGKS